MIDSIERHGCHNCKFRFVQFNFDDGPKYFCERGSSNRPLCPYSSDDRESKELDDLWKRFVELIPNYESLPLEEYVKVYKAEVRMKTYELEAYWEDWARDREVKAWSICPYWELEECV